MTGEVCPDCLGTRVGCGCTDCQTVGCCVACCSEADFAKLAVVRDEADDTP